jgi:hypothetical protein
LLDSFNGGTVAGIRADQDASEILWRALRNSQCPVLDGVPDVKYSPSFGTHLAVEQLKFLDHLRNSDFETVFVFPTPS